MSNPDQPPSFTAPTPPAFTPPTPPPAPQPDESAADESAEAAPEAHPRSPGFGVTGKFPEGNR